MFGLNKKDVSQVCGAGGEFGVIPSNGISPFGISGGGNDAGHFGAIISANIPVGQNWYISPSIVETSSGIVHGGIHVTYPFN